MSPILWFPILFLFCAFVRENVSFHCKSPLLFQLDLLFVSFSEGLPEEIMLLTANWRTGLLVSLPYVAPALLLPCRRRRFLHHTCALLCLRHDIEMFIQEAMIHRLLYNKEYQYLRHEEREGAGGGGLGLEA